MTEALLDTALQLEQAGKPAEAARLYREVLRADPAHFRALYQLGCMEFANGRFDGARTLFEKAAALRPGDGDAQFALGCALQRLNLHEDAVRCFAKVLTFDPKHVDALVNRGVSSMALRRFTDAGESFQAALVLQPERAGLWLAHGDCLSAGKSYAAALGSYDNAIALNPDSAEALCNRGAALFALQRYGEAAASYESLLMRNPRAIAALLGRGLALMELKREREALTLFETAHAADPGRADALYHRGRALFRLQRYGDALAGLDASLARDRNNADVWCLRGIVLKQLGRMDDALASQSQALSVDPGCIGALANRETLLLRAKRYEEAIADCETALRLDPDVPYLRGDLAYCRLQCCEWSRLAEDRNAIAARVLEGKRVAQPFMALVLFDSPELQAQSARIWAASECAAPQIPLWRGERYRHERIRLAYLSSEFGNYAMMQLMAGVFEQHDRTRLETIAISLGADDGSTFRNRAVRAFDRFLDAGSKSDAEIAALLKELEIDIAVDLMGFTGGSRPGILSHRAAPVQVQFLGFPGTMSAGHIDYIVADRIVLPPENQKFHSEQVAILPDSYQANDDSRMVANRTPARGEMGLPEAGFVFCCFNNNFKIAPDLFAIWMRLLTAVNGSVLWLMEDNPVAARNLRSEAERAGVAPSRLVFAPRLAIDEHLARQRLGDLFLDTLPCGAHTTASDALWAGLPVMTCLGKGFAGRVAASLNHAAGVPELVARSLEEYEEIALRLATQPDSLATLKRKLADSRTACALFDTARFARNLEAAYIRMWERAERGEPPLSFAVAP